MFPSSNSTARAWGSNPLNNNNNNNNNSYNNFYRYSYSSSYSYNMQPHSQQDLRSSRLKTATPQPQVSDYWARKSDLDFNLDHAGSDSPANTATYFNYDTQLLPEDPFSMGDFLGETQLNAYTSAKQPALDPSLWHPTGRTPRYGDAHKNVNLDYFALEEPSEVLDTDSVVAPSDLLAAAPRPAPAPRPIKYESAPSSPAPSQTQEQAQEQEQAQAAKPPSKRGRKRKQLDSAAQVVERRKFLERNRVAANRCRERKKTYVSTLESRANDLQARNTFLREELQALNEEVAALRGLAAVKCACDEEQLQSTLRERLSAGGMQADGVEEVVTSFLSDRADGAGLSSLDMGLGVDMGMGMGIGIGIGMNHWDGRQSRSSTASSVEDEVFSPTGLKHEHGSEQSSPMDTAEMEKSTYRSSS